MESNENRRRRRRRRHNKWGRHVGRFEKRMAKIRRRTPFPTLAPSHMPRNGHTHKHSHGHKHSHRHKHKQYKKRSGSEKLGHEVCAGHEYNKNQVLVCSLIASTHVMYSWCAVQCCKPGVQSDLLWWCLFGHRYWRPVLLLVYTSLGRWHMSFKSRDEILLGNGDASSNNSFTAPHATPHTSHTPHLLSYTNPAPDSTDLGTHSSAYRCSMFLSQ